MNVWRRAGSCLRVHKRSAGILAAAELCLLLMLTGTGYFLQQSLLHGNLLGSLSSAPAGGWELWLGGCLLTAVLVLTPVRVQSAWMLGEMTGVLDENDIGFLQCSGNLWLWRRMLAARLLLTGRLLLSLLPAVTAWTAGGVLMRLMPVWRDGFPALLAAAHLRAAGIGLLALPLRVLGAWLALPFCFLKTPHRSARETVRNAVRLSRHHSGMLLLRRGICLPLLLVPPAAFLLLPRLAASELLWASRRWTRCCGSQQMRLGRCKNRHFLSCRHHKTPAPIPAERCAIR